MVDLTFLPGLVTSTTSRIRYSPATIDSFDQSAIARALNGDEDTMRRLIRALRPTVQAEVAWTLHRHAPQGRGRDARQELADMVQEVFLSLGLVAEEKLASLYSGGDLFVMPNIPVDGDMEGFGVVML
ncbi:MAG: hypothetical protein AAF449_02550, partial [Myxococcota bacterium]